MAAWKDSANPFASHEALSVAVDLSRSIDPDGDAVGGLVRGRVSNVRVLTGASFAAATAVSIRRTVEWVGLA